MLSSRRRSAILRTTAIHNDKSYSLIAKINCSRAIYSVRISLQYKVGRRDAMSNRGDDRPKSYKKYLLWTVTHQLAMKAVGESLLPYSPMSIVRAARRSSWASRLRAARRSSWTSRLRAARRSSWASRLRAARRSSWASRLRAARPRLYKYARCVYLGASCSRHSVARLSDLRIVKLYRSPSLLLLSIYYLVTNIFLGLWS